MLPRFTKSSYILLISLLLPIYQADAESSKPPYNIILIINDQETYKLPAAQDYILPARQTLSEHGVTFKNHYTAAAMCSPSRATFLTGTPPQVNGVIDQMEYDFVPSLKASQPNIGSILKQLGYRTAYFGKFEMDKDLLADKTSVNYSTLAQPYGFDVFNPEGDVGGMPQQGFYKDPYYVGEAVQWLRHNQSGVNKSTQPFFMVVSLLNPHDIMYGDANLPGQSLSQKPAVPIILPPPLSTIYQRQWNFPLPVTLTDSLTAKGMPSALSQYQKGWSGAFGYIPTQRPDMWHFYDNYYLNALADNDRTLQWLMATLTELKLWKNTVVILTADHGEMGGSHGGLRGKGPFAYEENSHIPLIIAAPQGSQNATSSALTSHLDLLPTIVALSGLPKTSTHSMTDALRGHDFSSVVIHPEHTSLHAVRPGVLFNYVGISTLDGTYLLNILKATTGHQGSMPSLHDANLSGRGLMWFVFDGKYKFARYYSLNDINLPTTLDEIYNHNDIQLFDLQRDPNEKHNLALDKQKYATVILQMNGLLNELIKKEVGTVSDQFLPAAVQEQLKR